MVGDANEMTVITQTIWRNFFIKYLLDRKMWDESADDRDTMIYNVTMLHVTSYM